MMRNRRSANKQPTVLNEDSEDENAENEAKMQSRLNKKRPAVINEEDDDDEIKVGRTKKRKHVIDDDDEEYE